MASVSTAPSANDDAPLPVPNLALPQLAFVLTEPKAQHKREGAQERLLKGIEDDGSSPPSARFRDLHSLQSSWKLESVSRADECLCAQKWRRTCPT
jgi:hypothetical protein